MELDDFLLKVDLKAEIEEPNPPKAWDNIGLAHRNAHFSIWDQKPIRMSEVTARPEEMVIGFGLFDADYFDEKRQTAQHIFSPTSVEEGIEFLSRFKKLSTSERDSLEYFVRRAETDNDVSVIFVEDDTDKKRNKGVIAFDRDAYAGDDLATIFSEVRHFHVEGSSINRAALMQSFFMQMKTDYRALDRSMEEAGISDCAINVIINATFTDDESVLYAFDQVPDWIKEEIADDLRAASSAVKP